MSQQRTAVRHPSRQRPRQKVSRRRGPSPLVVVGVIVAIFGGVAVLLAMGGKPVSRTEVAPVRIDGTALPLQGAGRDLAVGMRMPEVRGVDFFSDSVEIVNDGRPKAILLLAHWCPHCQREVPKVVAWLNARGAGDVDVFALSTWATESKPNWPPSAWLTREGWPTPVLVDDAASSAAEAFGLSVTPLWVFVKADGTIAGRIPGAIEIARLDSLMRELVSGAAAP